jgi:hypothetical protein
MKLVGLIKMYLDGTCNKVLIGKHLRDDSHIQNGLRKQGGDLTLFLSNFALEYAIKRVKENQVGLKLNGTHQLLACVENVNLFGDNINTINKNKITLIGASKKVDLDVNTEGKKVHVVRFEDLKYMLISCNQNAEQYYKRMIANISFENAGKFRYFRKTEQIKS